MTNNNTQCIQASEDAGAQARAEQRQKYAKTNSRHRRKCEWCVCVYALNDQVSTT